MNGNKNGEKLSMNFDESQLTEKSKLLDEEITITAVGEEKQGTLGDGTGKFAIADITYDGDPMQIALGTVLVKQFGEWKAKAGEKALPCKAVITKPRGKRYFSFSNIEAV